MEHVIAAIPSPLIPLPIRMGRGLSIDEEPSPPSDGGEGFRERRFCPIPLWLGLVLALLLVSNAIAANWPQFRGPQASGVDQSKPAPVRWNVERGENVLWRTAIPGLAHASPVVWGDRIYILTVVGDGQADLKVGLYGDVEPVNNEGSQRWRLLAIDKAKGTILWDKAGHEAVPRVKRHPKSTHGSSTPATDGLHLVAIFGSEGLFCFDLEGKQLWKRDLGPMDSAFFQSPTAQWGFASSPVIHDGKVVVLCDVLTDPFIAVFDLADGRELWRVPRTDVPTWSTPTVVQVDRQTHILVNGWRHSGAYDFATGQEIWKLDGGGDIPVPTPIVDDEMAFLTSAHGRFRPMRAIRLDARGNITPAHPGATNAAIVWAHPRQGNYMQTPIVTGQQLYACADNGVLTCFDARTGKIHYSERLGNGGEGFTASPVSDGKHLYFASELGSVFVVPASTSFSVVATNALEETSMATPALCEGTLFFRTREHLVAIGHPPGK